MNRTEILEAFSKLSADEQKAVQAELVKKSAGEETSCCPPPMKEKLTGMMAQMEASQDPMAMCHEMMRMCCEKVETHKTCK